MSFMFLSLTALAYILTVMPYSSALMNHLNIVNEFFSLLVAYTLLEL